MSALARHAWPIGVAAAAFTVAVGLPAGDPDSWWHLASGRWMVEHREVLRVDVFSSTATGEPYALGEWLGEIVLYAAYALLSWTGIAIVRGICVALAAFALTRLALRAAPPAVAIPLAGLALILSKPIWTDRPQLFTLALFPLVLDLLLMARAGSRRALIATIPVVLIWSDLHAGYALGLALAWIVVVDAALERRPAGALVAAALAMTVLVGANPGALPPLGAAGHVTSATRSIVEESPIDVLTPFGILFALFVGTTFVVFLRSGGPLLALLVLTPMLALALTAQRYVPLFGFASVPFLAAAIARELRGARWPTRTFGDRARRPTRTVLATRIFAGVAGAMVRPDRRPAARSESEDGEKAAASRAVALVTALWIGAIASIPFGSPNPDLRGYPVAATSALRSSGGVLLNEYDWGGWLIWNVPERPVFIDGRLFPFTVSGVLRDQRTALFVLPDWHTALRRRNVSQALLRPDRALAQALRDEGWKVLAQDATFILLERPR